MLKAIPLLFVLIAGGSAGCAPSTPPSANNRTAGGSATPASTSRQDSANTATPIPPTHPDESAGNDQVFEGTAGITEKKNPNAKDSVVMAYVRSARHEGFDRVVFEFLGDQLPAYKVEYIGKPVQACGSGNEVSFNGNARLSVLFTGSQAHAPEGDATIPVKDRTQSPNLPIVKDLKMICDFEAEVEWVIGAEAANEYRVIELKNPTRLVVDIRH